MASGPEALSRTSPLFRKLKPGPSRATRDVGADQRKRIEAAMVELAADSGYTTVRVRALSRAAGVSTRTFYQHFANTEECFIATYESLMSCALRNATLASRSARAGESGLRSLLRSIARDIAARPKAARLTLIEAYDAGPLVEAQTARAIAGFEHLLSTQITTCAADVRERRTLGVGMVGGVMRVLRMTLLSGRATDTPILTSDLEDWAVSIGFRPHSSRAALDSPTALGSQQRWSTPAVDAVASGRPRGERARILSAVTKLAAAGGYASLTIPKIRTEAGVSRRSFDRRYARLEECFLDALELIVSSSVDRAERNAAEATGRDARIARIVSGLCGEAVRNQPQARLVFLEILGPGRPGLLRREDLLSSAARNLRATSPPARRPTLTAAEASLGAAWHAAHNLVAGGRWREIHSLAPLVSYLLLASADQPRIDPEPALDLRREA